MLRGLGFLIGKRVAIDWSTDECTVAFVDSARNEQKSFIVHSERCLFVHVTCWNQRVSAVSSQPFFPSLAS